MLLVHEEQLTQMVGVAQTMLALVAQIRLPVVVNGATAEERKNPDVVHRLGPTLLVGLVIRQVIGAGHVKPIPFCFHTTTRLVEVRYLRGCNLLGDTLDRLLQDLAERLDDVPPVSG